MLQAYQNSFSFPNPTYSSLYPGLCTIVFWLKGSLHPEKLFLILLFPHFLTTADPGLTKPHFFFFLDTWLHCFSQLPLPSYRSTWINSAQWYVGRNDVWHPWSLKSSLEIFYILSLPGLQTLRPLKMVLGPWITMWSWASNSRQPPIQVRWWCKWAILQDIKMFRVFVSVVSLL